MKTDTNCCPPGRQTGAVRLLLLGLVGAALVWIVGRWITPVVDHPSISVSRAFLTLRDGKLFRRGVEAPFTGFMEEHFENGKLKSRSEVKGGVLDGVSEGWHTNGVRQVLEHFQRGFSHGVRVKWHENGRRMSEVKVEHGALHGTFRRWDENGALVEEIELRGGKPDGKSVGYYPSGFVRVEAVMKEGQIVERKEWPDGERKPPPPSGAR